jgi:hypothetical protein
MRNLLWAFLLLAGVLAQAAGGRSADKPSEKSADVGLQPGKDEIGGPFRPYNVTGKDRHRGKFHPLVSEYGLNPVVLVFVRGVDPGKPVLDLLQQLDTLVQQNERIRLGSFAVFLSNDIKDLVTDNDKREQEAAGLLDKVKKLDHIAVALDVPADVRDAYKLGDKDEVTVILYNKFRVELVRTFTPKTLDEAGIKSLVDEINGKLDALRGPTAARPKKKAD